MRSIEWFKQNTEGDCKTYKCPIRNRESVYTIAKLNFAIHLANSKNLILNFIFQYNSAIGSVICFES